MGHCNNPHCTNDACRTVAAGSLNNELNAALKANRKALHKALSLNAQIRQGGSKSSIKSKLEQLKEESLRASEIEDVYLED